MDEGTFTSREFSRLVARNWTQGESDASERIALRAVEVNFAEAVADFTARRAYDAGAFRDGELPS